VLRVVDLVKHYREGEETVRAVDGVSLQIASGEMVALYGPSGSGKSTLCDLIAGFQKPDAGAVFVDGQNIAALSDRAHGEYLRRSVGVIGGEDDLWPSMSVRDNACLKLLRDHPKTARRLIEPLLVELGLGDRLRHATRKLSKGEKQRVMIAQALSTDPKLVIADEPTGSLDRRRSREVLALIHDRCRRSRAAVLLVTHDPQAVTYADRAHELCDGQLCEYVPETLYLRAGEGPHQPAHA
jgi:putative ABC transport system ATP-binding protein